MRSLFSSQTTPDLAHTEGFIQTQVESPEHLKNAIQQKAVNNESLPEAFRSLPVNTQGLIFGGLSFLFVSNHWSFATKDINLPLDS